MVRFISMLVKGHLVLVAVIAFSGCSGSGGGNVPEQRPSANSLRTEDLVGKWRLGRAGGESPAEMWIYSREIDIAADGTWKAKQRGDGPLLGMNQDCGGTWSLADGTVTYSNGSPDPIKAKVKVESGRLIVEPDFQMGVVKKGPPVTGEYERPSPPGPKKKEDLVAAMKFVKVPRGTFWMGWDSDNKQSRQVEIKQDFELAAYTVMQWQWQELMGNNPSDFSRHGRNSGRVPYDDEDLRRFPVEDVSWNDAQEFLEKLNEREKGKGWLYRLPTEAEWEYACRGAATSKEECSFDFYFDKPTNELSPKFANFGNKNVTVKVGSYPPNKLGLYDMHGNVSQWCQDLSRPEIKTVTARVTRGGNWDRISKGCRAAARETHEPKYRLNYCGFRVARVASNGLCAKDLVGKWRLVRAGGQPPIELYIKSQEIDIAVDGTWTSRVEMQPPQGAADKFHGKGTWALADGMLSWKYTVSGGAVVRGAGPDSGKSPVRLESGRLIVDPDFFMQARKRGTNAVAGEYER